MIINLCSSSGFCVPLVIIIVNNSGFTYKLNSEIYVNVDAFTTKVAEMYIFAVNMPACGNSGTAERIFINSDIGEIY
jgi:hypothetical protein